jgi:hypothetical protein
MAAPRRGDEDGAGEAGRGLGPARLGEERGLLCSALLGLRPACSGFIDGLAESGACRAELEAQSPGLRPVAEYFRAHTCPLVLSRGHHAWRSASRQGTTSTLAAGLAPCDLRSAPASGLSRRQSFPTSFTPRPPDVRSSPGTNPAPKSSGGRCNVIIPCFARVFLFILPSKQPKAKWF